MKTASKIIAVTVTLASLAVAGVVLAHPGQGMGPGTGMGPGMGPGMGMMGHGMGPGMGPGMAGRMQGPEMAATHLAELKTQLSITAAQEPAWQAFETFVRQQAETRQSMQAQMQARMNDPKASATDRAAQREAMTQQRDSHLKARDEARAALYAVLTPEQKVIADQHMAARRGHRMAMQAPAKWAACTRPGLGRPELHRPRRRCRARLARTDGPARCARADAIRPA